MTSDEVGALTAAVLAATTPESWRAAVQRYGPALMYNARLGDAVLVHITSLGEQGRAADAQMLRRWYDEVQRRIEEQRVMDALLRAGSDAEIDALLARHPSMATPGTVRQALADARGLPGSIARPILTVNARIAAVIGDDGLRASCLTERAMSALREDDFAPALADLDAAGDLWRSIGDPFEAGRCMSLAGNALLGLGRPDEALGRFRRSIALLAEAPEGDRLIGPTYEDIAQVLARRGDTDGMWENLEASARHRLAAGQRERVVAMLPGMLAWRLTRRSPEALGHAETLADLWPDHPDAFDAGERDEIVRMIGGGAVRAAIDSQGEALYLRSLEPYRAKVDPEGLAVARRWHAVAERVQPMAPSEEGDAVLRYVDALLSVSSGQSDRAVTQAQAALRYFDAHGGHEQSRGLMILLSEAEGQRGDLVAAVRWCDEALRRTTDSARSFATLGITRGGYLLRLGRARPAIDDLNDAIRLSREDDDVLARTNEGAALSVLSRAYEYLGDLRGALEATRDSLRIARTLGHKLGEATQLAALGTLIGKHVTGWLGTTLSTADADVMRGAVFQADPSLATAWPENGLPGVAVALLERAERLFTEIHDEEGATMAALNLCNLLPAAQDKVEILTGLVSRKDAIGDRLGTAPVLANLGAAYAALGQNAQAVDAFERSLAISRPAGFFESAAQAARDLAELRLTEGDVAAAEAGFTEAVGLIEAARADLPLTDHHRVGFVRNKGDAYLSLVDLLTAREAYDEAFELVQRAKSRALLEITAGAAALDPITIPGLRAWLAAQGRPVLLVEYFLTGDQITLFFLRPEWEHVAAHRQPFTADDLWSGYEDFRRQVVAYRSAGSAGWTRLGAVLTEPLAAHVKPGDLIYLVPHRLLHGLPIHALPLGPEPLIVGHPVAYAPASGLLPLSQGAAKGTGRLDSCASFGVVFEEEAREVAALFGAEMAERPQADQVEELCAGKDVCHFSCHGYFNAEYPLSSGLVVGEDDVLSAREVMGMRLRAELISLSACDSGASQVGEGDELLGLLRAFLHAGASSLVAGLWTVDADSTRELMAAFYGRLRDDYLNHRPVDKAEALRQAQLRLMRQHGVRSAYHWAPFVLVGDWRLASGGATHG